MKNIMVLAAISLFSLCTFAHPIDSNHIGISAVGPHGSPTGHGTIQFGRSEKMTMSDSDTAAYAKAQDLFLAKRKEYNEQKLKLMMLEAGPVRRDVEKDLEYYQNNLQVAKRQVEVYEARFDTRGRSKLV